MPDLLWYHVQFSTFGTWLRGDERGFRDHDHRLHSSGDYRNPPPPGEHEGLRLGTLARMHKPSMKLAPGDLSRVGDRLVSRIAGAGGRSSRSDRRGDALSRAVGRRESLRHPKDRREREARVFACGARPVSWHTLGGGESAFARCAIAIITSMRADTFWSTKGRAAGFGGRPDMTFDAGCAPAPRFASCGRSSRAWWELRRSCFDDGSSNKMNGSPSIVRRRPVSASHRSTGRRRMRPAVVRCYRPSTSDVAQVLTSIAWTKTLPQSDGEV